MALFIPGDLSRELAVSPDRLTKYTEEKEKENKKKINRSHTAQWISPHLALAITT